MKMLLSAVSLSAAVALSGCSNMSTSEQRTLSGAAIGTAAGAAIGAMTGSAATGAAIGAAGGAAGGYIYDRSQR